LIEHFDDLLELARKEAVPVRLLTVLVRAEAVLPVAANGPPAAGATGGLLIPIRVKDHAIEPDLDFARLHRQADENDGRWAFMMVGVLPGQDGHAPSPASVDDQLKLMARAVHTGSGLERYLFFDRNGEPVQISNPDD